jgi:riboflavin biosynthesis pyrimidine reductase
MEEKHMPDRPYIVIQISTSLDARVALGPNRTMWEEMADPRAVSAEYGGDLWNEVGAKIAAEHHHQADMLGSGSLVKEGEELRALPPYEGDAAALYADYLPDEIIHRPDHKSWLTVVDGRGRLRNGYKGEDNPGCYVLHLTGHAAPPEYLAFLQREKIPYIIAGEERVNLPLAMEKMRALLGVTCLLCTGGGKLTGALLRAGLVDELNLILRPEAIGGTDTPTLFGSPDLGPDEPQTKFNLHSAQVRADGQLWLRYRTVR